MKISVVTPTFNAAAYLAETFASLSRQAGSFDLQHIVIDGGSTDGTLDVIKAHEAQIDTWVSEPDGGLYDAVQKGFALAEGDVLAWLNADDIYMPWALDTVSRVFTDVPDLQWLTSLNTLTIDASGDMIDAARISGVSPQAFLDGVNLIPYDGAGTAYSSAFIQQESTFFRRSLWEQAGAAPFEDYKLAGDFALWAKFMALSPPAGIKQPLGAFRFHSQHQLSTANLAGYVQESQRAYDAAVSTAGHSLPDRPKGETATYQGQLVEKHKLDDPASPWVVKEHNFHVVPLGQLKNLLNNKVLM